MKIRSLILLLAMAVSTEGITQDIHFSQFYLAPMQINPANAGAEAQIRANLNYKEQWKSVSSPYKTIGASYDMQFSKGKNGFFAGGINFYSDRAGESKMGVAQGNLNLAYHLKIAEGQTLGLGLMGGYAQRSVLTTDLQWGNQYTGTAFNPALASGEAINGNLTNSFFDLGTGLVYTFNQGEKYMTGNNQIAATLGASVYHIHQPDYSFMEDNTERLYRKFIIHGNGIVGIPNSRMSLVPGFQYQIQGGARELLVGSMIRYRLQEDSHFTGFVTGASLALGAFYRNKDAVAVTSLIQFGGYGIGISYDINISDLSQASNGRGGLEIALRFVYPSANSVRKSSRFL